MLACEGIMISVEEGTEDTKEKLQMYLDLWALQKEQLEDAVAQATRAGKQNEYALTYEIAKLNVSLNSEKHRTYLAECKLDDATVKIEDLQEKVVYYKKAVQKEEDRQCDQKVQELQKLLEVAESCHKQEVKALRENYETKMEESDLRFQSITHVVKEKKEQLNNVRHLIEQLQGKLEESSQTRDDSIIQVTVANLELSELKVEARYLKDKLAALEEHGSPATNANAQILQDVVKQKELQIERLLEDIIVKEQILRDVAKQKELEIERLSKDIDVKEQILLDVVRQKELEIERLSKDICVKEEILLDTVKQKELDIERLLKDIGVKNHALEDLSSEKVALHDQLELSRKELQEGKELAEKNKKEAAVAEKGHKKSLKELEKQLTAATKLVTKKEHALQKLAEQLEELLQEKIEYKKVDENNLKQLKDMEEKCTEAARLVDEKNKLLENVMKQFDEVSKEIEHLKTQCLEYEIQSKEEKIDKVKFKNVEEQYITAAKAVEMKDEKLKEVMQLLGILQKDNETLSSKCSKLEGGIEQQLAEAHATHKMKVEELEEQFTVANTLVTKLDKKIKRLTQKLEESENTFATVDNQHSEALEMHKKKLRDIEQRCNESTKLVNSKEILLKEVKQKLEDMQKENEQLKQQVTELLSSEQEIGVEIVPLTKKEKPKAAPASSRKPLAEVPIKDTTKSKGGAPPRGRSKQLPKESEATTAANLQNRLEQAVDTSINGNGGQTSGGEEENDSGVSEPMPKNKSTKKRPRKGTEEAMDCTPPAKRKPPRSTRKLIKVGDKAGPILLPAQLLVGSTPLPLKPNAPSIPSRRKLGSFSGTLPR